MISIMTASGWKPLFPALTIKPEPRWTEVDIARKAQTHAAWSRLFQRKDGTSALDGAQPQAGSKYTFQWDTEEERN